MKEAVKSPATVLVIDAQDSAEEVSQCLRGAGYAVQVCHQKELARTLLEEQHFGAVLCDPAAVDLDMRALIHSLADAPAWIELAGFGSVEDAVDSVRHGAADYIQKPFTEQELLVKVSKAMDSRRLHGQFQLFVDVPSAGISNAATAIVELTPKPTNQFSTLELALPSNIAAVINGEFSDVKLKLSLNAVAGSGPWHFDNIRFL